MTFQEIFIFFVEDQGWIWTKERTTGPLGACISRIAQKRKQSDSRTKDPVFIVKKRDNILDTAIMVCADGAIYSENGVYPMFEDNLYSPGSLERIKQHIEKRNRRDHV